MTVSAPDPSALAPGGLQAARGPAAGWQGAWALLVGLGAALLLVVLGNAPPRALAALALGATPGVLGFLYRPRRLDDRVRVLAAWTLCCGLAAAITGGVGGPLAAWLLGPLLCAAAFGGLWRAAAGQAFAALIAVAIIQAGGRAGTPLTGAVGLGVGLVGLSSALAMGAAALMMLMAGGTREVAEAGVDPDLSARVAEAEAARDAAISDARGKMQFLANMSHELRTPLNAIMGFSDMMRAKVFGELPPRYAEYAELIHEGGAHLLDLINDLLDVSKIEADKYELSREAFDAREAVGAALRILRQQADGAGVQLRGVLPAHPIEIDADRRALKQIVLNLVSNALKFTPAGGSVSVSLATAAGALEIAVADTGIGIAPDDLERIGRPYEQAGDAADRARGTGLGLSLVRAFARLHGGDMAIESRLGEGTAVTVRLPVLQPMDTTQRGGSRGP